MALSRHECQFYGLGPTGANAGNLTGVVDRYGGDVLGGDWRRPPRGRSVELAAEPGTVVEDVETGWVGAVVRVEKAGGLMVVHLEDRHGRTRGFRLGPGFLVDGAPVTLTPPKAADAARLAAARTAASRTASGSRAVTGQRAKVASGSRIFVEGKHDAELVEKVWGADLRVEGVVVEMLDGVDDLAGAIRDFARHASAPDGGARRPPRARHQGVARRGAGPGRAAVRRARARRRPPLRRRLAVGQAAAPGHGRVARHPARHLVEGRHRRTPRVAALDPARISRMAWRRILGAVDSYADLEPELLGRVEELIDFVTAPV